jgi:hypothetical protein
MAVNYTASIWTLVTSSANVPPFDPSLYTLKGTIDNTSHTQPGNPYLYPINLTIGQNLYTVFTAPSGATEIQRLCVSMSFEYDPSCPGNNPWKVYANLRSGSCAASGSATWQGAVSVNVQYQAVDSNNNYYYGDIEIFNGQSEGTDCIDVNGFGSLVNATAEIINNADLNYVVDPCANCGIPDQLYFDNEYAVVVPASVTSSTYPAQIIAISGSNYAIKVSSSVDGLIANVDTAIGWIGTNTPVYYTASFGSTYYSTAISASVQRNNCSSGYEGSYVLYTLPASHSSATSSQVDAQNAAQAYFNSTSQSYANTYGTCTATGSTVDVYAKFINTEATLQYSINAGSPVVIDVIDSLSCIYWVQIVCNAGDTITFDTTATNAISGNSTGACPANAAGCDYTYVVNSGTNSVYITVNGAISC